METLLRNRTHLYGMALVALVVFVLGADTRSGEARDRGETPHSQSRFGSLPQAHIEALRSVRDVDRSAMPVGARHGGLAAQTGRVEGETASAPDPQDPRSTSAAAAASRDIAACCLRPDPDCPSHCIETNELDCAQQGGVFLEDVPECYLGDEHCEPGACLSLCPYDCQDNGGTGMACEDCLTIGGEYYGGVRCDHFPQSGPCPFNYPQYCMYDDQGERIPYIDRSAAAPEEPYPRWADDFMAENSGPIDRICWWPCFYDPYNQQECHEDPPAEIDAGWRVRFYEDNAGIPGSEIGISGGYALTPDLKACSMDVERCWEYTAPIVGGPEVTAGECYWIEITGYGDQQGCQVYWLSNGNGNKYSLNDRDGTWGPEDVQFVVGHGTTEVPYSNCIDLSFCVNAGIQGDCGEIPGACYFCGEEGLECDPDDITHNDCREPWGPFTRPEGVVFLPYWDCDTGWCNDGVTLCSISEQDCPPGLEPCMGPPPGPIPGDNCDGGLFGPIPLHDGAPDDLCPTLPCTFAFDNTCAYTDGPNPECGTEFGADIWFEFYTQVGECGWLTIDTCTGGTYDGIIAFYGLPFMCYPDCPVDSATIQSCDDDGCGTGGGMPYIPNPSDPDDEIYVCQDDPEMDGLNRWYYIRMGGWNGAYGSGQMTISFTPDPAGCTPELCPPCS